MSQRDSSALRLRRPGAAVDGEISMPGSKSYTNRALVMAAIAEGESSLASASPSDDSRALIAALQKLGIETREEPEGARVFGKGGAFAPFRGCIDVGPAGTTMRFLTALCAFVAGGEITLQGSARMHQRPISELVNALRSLGADIEHMGTAGCPPLRIRGGKVTGGSVNMRGDVSSQYFTALLLAAPLCRDGLELRVSTEQISKSYIDMTIAGMREFGVEVENEAFELYRVRKGQRYSAGFRRIEGDASGASYLWALAAAGGGRVRVRNIRHDSVQGDARFPELLEKMGCRVTRGTDERGDWIAVEGAARGLRGIECDMSLMPDTAQTLAVLAAIAKGRTTIGGLSTLRHKETDRLAALVTELAKLGIRATVEGDSLSVEGGQPHPARIATYDDHRMAMAFAVLSSALDGLEIEEPAVVNKSFPGFWSELGRFGVRTECA